LEEDDRENFQGSIEEGEDKGSVESNSCDHGFCGEHDNGARKVFCNDRTEVHFEVLVRVVIACVACFGAQTLCFVFE